MNRLLLILGLPAVLIGIVSAVVVAQSISSTDGDVRIVARQLADGRVEFALEQDGELIQPRARYFPTDAPVDRWLRSSPIEIEQPEPSSTSSSSSTTTSAAHAINGSGDSYQSAGHFDAGNYVCSVSVTGNSTQYGGTNFAVVSYGADGSYGNLHANEIASSYSGTSRLVVGSGWSADVPVGEVYFEVSAAASGRWTISCR